MQSHGISIWTAELRRPAAPVLQVLFAINYFAINYFAICHNMGQAEWGNKHC
jgi:hypothetical protein